MEVVGEVTLAQGRRLLLAEWKGSAARWGHWRHQFRRITDRVQRRLPLILMRLQLLLDCMQPCVAAPALQALGPALPLLEWLLNLWLT